MKPLILINFKTYKNATGKKAVKLAKICNIFAKETKTNIAIAVQATDIYRIKQEVKIPIYAQHIDGINFGSNTGYMLPEAIKNAGAKGTLLNHSEHRLNNEKIKLSVKRARELGLKVIICARNIKKGIEVSKFKPDFVAIEPPELIGGIISISTAKPQLITKAVNKINSPILVGAGVHTGEDVKHSLNLGAKGVLLASGVTKATNPKKELNDLISCL